MAGAQACGEGKIAGLYDLERTLGKGHFAVVKLARHVFTGQRVAVKVIDKSKLAGEAAGHCSPCLLSRRCGEAPRRAGSSEGCC
uniref:Uncharacterized protein n=1 Tax=Nothoprocta perdicaria TaxID=30464 RepID=A0A8C6Z2J2_NOTPE